MLRFDLAEIVRTPGRRQVYQIDEPPYSDEDVEFVSPVKGEVTVTNTGSMLLVRGGFRSTIEMECSRCLEPVRIPIDVELEEEFDLKIVEDATHHDHQVEIVEDEIGRVFEGKVMDLAVLIRQAALLAAPLQPLCREDCPGIAMRSAESSAEEDARKQSPFSELAKLLED